jgi:protein-S-isoprenylcysteine O-methyltransferase Ste14
MRRTGVLVYGVVCYAVFFATFLYLVGFVGNLFVPKSIDSGTPGPLGTALLVNTALLLGFGLQHSVMARPRFKAWVARSLPPHIERSTYVLASSAVLIAWFAFWQPIPQTVWEVTDPIGRAVLTGLFLAGVGLVLLSTFLIDHFDLFGLRQAVLHFRGLAYQEKRFATPLLYRWIRHPLYVGWLVTFWATPAMSAGHFLLALVLSSYILVAIPLEERDLLAALGDPYRRWRERTPLFVPRVGRAEARTPVQPVRQAAEPR